jgi:hypothetical protein
MSKNDVLITLIKEVVKNEVKQQLKEEIAKLIKSGKLQLPENKKVTNSPKTQVGGGGKLVTNTGFGKGGMNISDIPYNAVYEYDTEMYPNVPKKEYTKNTALNEILNQTKPFTAAERASGPSPMMSMTGGSVLDSIQRKSEDDWGTISLDTSKMAKQSVSSAQPENVDAVTKALTRDYSELVKRFK